MGMERSHRFAYITILIFILFLAKVDTRTWDTSRATLFSSGAQVILQGNATDGSGEGISNVTVNIVELNRYTVTDSHGRYWFDGIPQGNYTLVFTRQGYHTLTMRISITGDGPSIAADAVLKPTFSMSDFWWPIPSLLGIALLLLAILWRKRRRKVAPLITEREVAVAEFEGGRGP